MQHEGCLLKDVGTHIHLQRITRIKDTLQSHLSTALATALKEMKTNPSDPTVKAALVQCLRTYALLDQTTSAEQVIRKEMITPALSNVSMRDTMQDIYSIQIMRTTSIHALRFLLS